MRIGIGNDHAGLVYKKELCAYLTSKGHTVEDFGTASSESSNYPDIAEMVAHAVQNGPCERGILICGTGIGMMITANKVRGIRCAICPDEFSAEMARRHNDINILSLGARVMDLATCKTRVDIFLETPAEGGRHEERRRGIARVEETKS